MSDTIKALVKEIRDLDAVMFSGDTTEEQLNRYDVLLDTYDVILENLDTSLLDLDPDLDITGNAFQSSVL